MDVRGRRSSPRVRRGLRLVLRRRTAAVSASAIVSACAAVGLLGVPFVERSIDAVGMPLVSDRGLPVPFEANAGQADRRARFVGHTAAGTVFVTAGEVVLNGADGAVRLRLQAADPEASPKGLDRLGTRVNYLRGPDPARWVTDVATYGQVSYGSVYPGVDLVCHGVDGLLRYDLVVAPGADPAPVAFAASGVGDLRVDPGGDVVSGGGDAQVRLHLVAYQDLDGTRHDVAARYRMARGGRISFALGTYDRSLPLVLDSSVSATPSRPAGDGAARAVAVDPSGRAYVVGSTPLSDYPPAGGSASTSDAVSVTRLNRSGSRADYVTYLAGAGDDEGAGVAVDGSGRAYVTGTTSSGEFPTTEGSSFQAAPGGGTDAFVARLSPTGSSIEQSSYLGGSGDETGRGIAVDASGNAYVTGSTSSSDFPVAGRPFQPALGGGTDTFVAKVDPSGSTLLYAGYLGGTASDTPGGIAVDEAGDAYVAGTTASRDFPVAGTPVQAAPSGGDDAFVAKIDPDGSTLAYSTYLGGGGDDEGASVAVDSSGCAYVAGTTASADFPLAGTPAQAAGSGGSDGFVAKLQAFGSGLIYSTYLGGGGADGVLDVKVDQAGVAHVVGASDSGDFPVVGPAYAEKAEGVDGFVAHVDPNGASLSFSTWLGAPGGTALALDPDGHDEVAGVVHGVGPDGGDDAAVVRVGGTGAVPRQSPPADFDGDGATDVSVFRPSTGAWLVAGRAATALGGRGDIPVPCDYDGDGVTDRAVFRPSVGGWYVDGQAPVFFGLPGDIPVPGSYDGDGRCELAVFRPSSGTWYVRGRGPVVFGRRGDVPVPGDYDGDGRTDVAVYRPSSSTWLRAGADATQFGQPGDVPVPGDYDGNGTTDIAVFRPGDGGWYVDVGGQAPQFLGGPGDVPVPGDYLGTGTTVPAVYRASTGQWFLTGRQPVVLGAAGDLPLPLPAAIRSASSVRRDGVG